MFEQGRNIFCLRLAQLSTFFSFDHGGNIFFLGPAPSSAFFCSSTVETHVVFVQHGRNLPCWGLARLSTFWSNTVVGRKHVLLESNTIEQISCSFEYGQNMPCLDLARWNLFFCFFCSCTVEQYLALVENGRSVFFSFLHGRNLSAWAENG